jgi:hypothetical protein
VYQALDELVQLHTSIETLQTLEYKLTEFLHIASLQRFTPPTYNKGAQKTTHLALQHQNMIGWENFMCGIQELLLNLWTNRNQTIFGKDAEECRMKAREMTIQKIKLLYQHPPKLANRFPQITAILIKMRIRRTTQQMRDWLTRIEHQQKVTAFLNATQPPGQLSIQQAFRNAIDRRCDKAKYPP